LSQKKEIQMLIDCKTETYTIRRGIVAPDAKRRKHGFRAIYSRRLWLLLIILSLALGNLAAEKLHLKPYPAANASKKHPYTALLRSPEKAAPIQKSKAINNRLLVLLVDFQEELEDDPNTTGNGKFQLEADPSYLYSIAAPRITVSTLSAILKRCAITILPHLRALLALNMRYGPRISRLTLCLTQWVITTPWAPVLRSL